MRSSSPDKKNSSEDLQKKLFSYIEDYNRNHPEEPINMLHGGSSGIFALIGRETRVQTKDKRSGRTQLHKVTIPPALIPTGILRKSYGIYPLSGELNIGVFGGRNSRKDGGNYLNLSGTIVSEEGFATAFGYSLGCYHAQWDNAKFLHEKIKDTFLNSMGPYFIRPYKVLLMYFTNLMLLEPNAKESAEFYLTLLNNEVKNAKLEKSIDMKMIWLIDKYAAELTKILNGDLLPFTPDDEFRSLSLNMFPILYCSTVKGKLVSNLPGEVSFRGEIPLSTVKIMFTPEQHQEQLRSLLKQHGLTHIKVIGYPYSPSVEQIEKEDNDIPSLGQLTSYSKLQAPTPEEVDYFVKLLNKYIKASLKEGKFDPSFVEGLLKQTTTLGVGISVFYTYYEQFKILNAKVNRDANYLRVIEPLLTVKYSDLQTFSYLYHLASSKTEYYFVPMLPNDFYNYDLPWQSGAQSLSKCNERFILKLLHASAEVLLHDLSNSKDKNHQTNIAQRIDYLKLLFKQYCKQFNESDRWFKEDYLRLILKDASPDFTNAFKNELQDFIQEEPSKSTQFMPSMFNLPRGISRFNILEELIKVGDEDYRSLQQHGLHLPENQSLTPLDVEIARKRVAEFIIRKDISSYLRTLADVNDFRNSLLSGKEGKFKYLRKDTGNYWRLVRGYGDTGTWKRIFEMLDKREQELQPIPALIDIPPKAGNSGV